MPELRLALESRHAIVVVRELLRQDLDRDVTLQLVVFGTVDFAHSTVTGQSRNFVKTELLCNRDRHESGAIIVKPFGAAK